MFVARTLRHLTPRQAKNGLGIHDGLRPRIAPKKDISALIQCSRWACLIMGIWYGNKRWHEISKIRGAEKAEAIVAYNKVVDAEAAAAAAATAEFAKTSLLYGNSE
jgi:hypothetical protein